MQIAQQMPARIKFHVHVRETRFIEDASPQHLLDRTLRTEFRYNDERQSAPCASEIDQRAQAVAGSRDALLYGSAATVGNDPAQQRREAPVPVDGLPDQSRCQVRAIVEEIAI